jgi:hypothetical protein
MEDAILHDTVVPLLVLCYNLTMVALFLFSCADVGKSGSLDFWLCDVCMATCGGTVSSVDGPW